MSQGDIRPPALVEINENFGGLNIVEALSVYNAYRAKVVAEDTLINARLSWMLWAEAILFAMWGSIVTGSITKSGHISPFALIAGIVINGIGFFAAFGSMKSLNAAYREIVSIKDSYKQAYPKLYASKEKIPRLHAGKKEAGLGFFLAKFMPWIFLAMQFLAAVAIAAAYISPGTMLGK